MKYLIFLLYTSAIIGCSPHWQYSNIFYGPYETLWIKCNGVLNHRGYTSLQSDKNLATVQTEWQNRLYPLRQGGYRTAIVLQILKKNPGDIPVISCPYETSNTTVGSAKSQNNSKDYYQIRLKVLREVNHSIHDFMSAQHAIWMDDGYDINFELLLLKDIERELYLESELRLPQEEIRP